MLSYCLKCGENTKSIIPQVSKAINCVLSKCAVCNTKKEEATGLLSDLSIRTLLSKIPILRDILF